MDIKNASKELYSELRVYDEVLGIGITKINGISYIVVYLAKVSKAILRKIPKNYKGNVVKTEITGDIILQ